MWIRYALICALATCALASPTARGQSHAEPHATSHPDAPAAAPAEKPRLLVLNLERAEVSEGTAKTVDALVALSAGEAAPSYEVVSSADMRRMMDLEAARETADCTDGESCMAEIAAALGAERVLFGTVGKLGDTTVITLDLFDAAENRAIGRRSIQSADMNTLPAAIRTGVSALLGTTVVSPQDEATASGARPALLWTTVGALAGAAASFGYAAFVAAEVSALTENTPVSGVQAIRDAQQPGQIAVLLGSAFALTAVGTGAAWTLMPEEAP